MDSVGNLKSLKVAFAPFGSRSIVDDGAAGGGAGDCGFSSTDIFWTFGAGGGWLVLLTGGVGSMAGLVVSIAIASNSATRSSSLLVFGRKWTLLL